MLGSGKDMNLRSILWRLRRWLPLLAAAVCLLLLYLLGRRNPHINSATLLVQNRYYHQLFHRAPPLSARLDRVSVVLFWTPFFSSNAFYVGYGAKPFAHCPVNDCVATNDRQYVSRARALVFHHLDTSHWDLPPHRTHHQLYVFFSMEAPAQPPHLLGQLNGQFNLTMTYRSDSDVLHRYGQVTASNGSDSGSDSGSDLASAVVSGRVPPPHTPSIAWVVSNCETASEREVYVRELSQYLPVSQYGGCNGTPCPEPCYPQLARTHLFYLAFENRLCRDYVTEKFFGALRAGLIPVVRGAAPSEYLAIAPPHSYIHVEDFWGPQELSRHLTAVAGNVSALAELTAWRRRYTVGSGSGWCQLCARLRSRDPAGGSTVPDLGRWWYGGSWCHRPPSADPS